jgi:flagellar biosynthesis protein FlhF
MNRNGRKEQQEPGMKMKSFFAPTVEEAMELARQEMGPDALLVNSRKAPPEARALGEYEVVFALLPEEAGEKEAGRAPEPKAESPSSNAVTLELALLRKQLEEMGRALTSLKAHTPNWAAPAPEFAEIYSRLVEYDFSIELAQEIVKQAHVRLDPDAASWTRKKAPFDASAIEGAVRTELERLISVDATLETTVETARVIALVGPPGCGKTTTLVKLAVNCGLASSRRVHLISADTRRVSGAEQLRTYATIIGATFDAADTPRGLQQSIEAHREKGLILVDTPGYGAMDMEEAAEWARFFSNQPGIEVHVVAPASMRSADLGRVLDRFEVFSPAKLIFTRLDETSSAGAMISESVRTGKPVSFLTGGQQIPEDLEAATAGRLLDLVFECQAARAASAA